MSFSTGRPQTPEPGGCCGDADRAPATTASGPPSTPQKKDIKTNAQLFTPPPTNESSRTFQFLENQASPTTCRRRRFQSKDDERALAGYVSLSDSNDLTDSTVSDSTSVTSCPSSPTHISASSKPPSSILEDTAEIVATKEPLTSNSSNAPFPFLKLPLNIRKEIYVHLLVVPGLICVRQNHTSYHNEEKAFLYAEPRVLLPGIAYALPQLTVGGFKIRLSRFSHTNTGILRASKTVYAEAKSVLYGSNSFEIICPNLEMSPPPDYRVRLFPRGCARLVRELSIRVRALYPLKWLLEGGHTQLKNAYRGLERLYIVLEMENADKGVAKGLRKKQGEKWVDYISRLLSYLCTSIFNKKTKKECPCLPNWIHLRVLFDGEAYMNYTEPSPHNIALESTNADMTVAAEGRLKRSQLKRGLVEAFESCKGTGTSSSKENN